MMYLRVSRSFDESDWSRDEARQNSIHTMLTFKQQAMVNMAPRPSSTDEMLSPVADEKAGATKSTKAIMLFVHMLIDATKPHTRVR